LNRCDSTGNKTGPVPSTSGSSNRYRTGSFGSGGGGGGGRNRSGSTGNRVKQVNKNYDNYYQKSNNPGSSVPSQLSGSYNASKSNSNRAPNPNTYNKDTSNPKVQTLISNPTKSKDTDINKENVNSAKPS
jgi:hypothetical protein